MISKDKSHYTGITTDLKSRFQSHNFGQSKYTTKKKPYKLIWYCAFANKNKAYQFEKYLKGGSGIAFSRKHFI